MPRFVVEFIAPGLVGVISSKEVATAGRAQVERVLNEYGCVVLSILEVEEKAAVKRLLERKAEPPETLPLILPVDCSTRRYIVRYLTSTGRHEVGEFEATSRSDIEREFLAADRIALSVTEVPPPSYVRRHKAGSVVTHSRSVDTQPTQVTIARPAPNESTPTIACPRCGSAQVRSDLKGFGA